MNVILQSFAASSNVAGWFLRDNSNSIITSNAQLCTSLFNTIARIIAKINKYNLNATQSTDAFKASDNEGEDELYAAGDVKRALSLHNWGVQSEEHDCHELFHLLMSVLDEEESKRKISQTSLNYFTPSNLQDSSKRPAKNPFHGYLINQLQCLDCLYKVKNLFTSINYH
jgi:hypothetical protein